MRIGERGLAIIKRYETLRLVAYLPTHNDRWTIGYGHTNGVHQGDRCTEAQADAWLREDVAVAERAVAGLGVPLSQSMYDALTSLVFNVGSAPLRQTIGRRLKARNYFGAWEGMAAWRKQGGKDLRGLARRRAEEMALFFDDPMPSKS
jgi:lysozyme